MSNKSDDQMIPAFLKVANRGKVKPPKQKGKAVPTTSPSAPKIDEAQAVLDAMPEDKRAFFDAQLKSGAIQRQWLLDPGTVALAWQAKTDKEETKRARIEALQALPKPERPPPGPAFGANTIFVINCPNPRKSGTGGWQRFEEMVAWKKKNPEGTVSQLICDTSYDKTDYKWDVERGHIKSGIVGQALSAEPLAPKTRTPKQSKVRAEKSPTLPPATEAVWSGSTQKKKATMMLAKAKKDIERQSAKRAVTNFGRRNIKKIPPGRSQKK